MDPIDAYDADPVRVGAAPALNVVSAGLVALSTIQPIWSRITEALVRWLRYHFAAAARIEHPDLVNRVWTTDRERAPILITSLAEFAPNESNKRPALLIDRFDQELDLSKRPIGGQHMGQRPDNYWQLMMGQHVVYCVGAREGEAETLAWEVWRDLTRFAKIAARALCLLRFQPVKIGRRTQLPEFDQTYAVPVICMYGYEEMWRTFPTDELGIDAIRVAALVI